MTQRTAAEIKAEIERLWKENPPFTGGANAVDAFARISALEWVLSVSPAPAAGDGEIAGTASDLATVGCGCNEQEADGCTHMRGGRCRRLTDNIEGALRAARAEAEEKLLEADAFSEDHRAMTRLVDRISDLVGLPHDQELDSTAFELWLYALNAKQASADAEIADLRASLAKADARGHVAGLREEMALSPINDDSLMFTVHNERERLHNAIDARIAELTPDLVGEKP